MTTLDPCTLVDELHERSETIKAAARQRLVDERSEAKQMLNGLDDQRRSLVRKIARLERELGLGGETSGAA